VALWWFFFFFILPVELLNIFLSALVVKCIVQKQCRKKKYNLKEEPELKEN